MFHENAKLNQDNVLTCFYLFNYELLWKVRNKKIGKRSIWVCRNFAETRDFTGAHDILKEELSASGINTLTAI